MKIRKIQTKDADALVKLYTPEKAVCDFSGMHTLKRFKHLVHSKEDILFVAEKDGEIAGAIDAEFYDESHFSYFANLVVSPKYRRQGVAGQLIREYERYCKKRKIKIIVSLVYDWNANMHQLMKKKKYVNNGKLVEYIRTLK